MSLKNVISKSFYAAILLLVVPFAHAAPQASLEASRVSGPAPLAVHFDATGTTDTNSSIDTFRELGYLFTFDDPNSGVWSASGKSKNEQRGGPIAAHVFETPGTYTVTVRAQDGGGQADTASVTITVTDPDQVYSGNNTVVISRDSDVSGAPAGAELITNASSWPTFESDKRYLLKAGQDFTSFGDMSLRQIQDFQVGKFGEGSNPRVGTVPIETGGLNTDIQWASRGVVSGLDAQHIYQGGPTDHMLIFRCSANGTFDIGELARYYYDHGPARVRDAAHWPRYSFLVESEISGSGRGHQNAYQGSGGGHVVLGSTLHSPNQHVVRMWFAYKAFIGHNHLYNAGSAQHYIKIHSGSTDDYSHDGQGANEPATQYVIAADNLIGEESDNVGWALAFSPQNGDAGTREGLQDVIVENNVFARASAQDVGLGGRRMTERGNSLRGGGSHSVGTSTHGGGIPSGWDGPYYLNGEVVIPPGQVASPPVTPQLTIE